MPPVSQKQDRAMHAAAAGKSTLGIPKKVGHEFVASDTKGSVKKLPKSAPKPQKIKKERHFGSLSPHKE